MRTPVIPSLLTAALLAAAAGCLAGEPRSWQFAVLFAFSAVMGAVSLSFLKRIPDVACAGPA